MMLAEEVTGESPKHIQASRQTVPVIPQTSTFREQGETSNLSASNAFSKFIMPKKRLEYTKRSRFHSITKQF